MKPKKIDSSQEHLFQFRLSQELNPRHNLFELSHKIPWQMVEEEFADLYAADSLGGSPPKPVRLIVGLLLLQNMHGLSDAAVVQMWVENPYWQYFCGYDYLQWQFPIDPSSLTRWRQRLGSEKLEKILALTVNAAVAVKMVEEQDLSTAIADTTVMPKNISYPTDSKLLNKMRMRLVKLAKAEGIELRQNYNIVAKKLVRQIGNYFHAKQYKRAHKAQKHLHTLLGRVVRDIERQISGNSAMANIFVEELAKCQQLLEQKRDSKNKLYSLHAPEVVCISKGKRHKPYEFGCKVSLVTTHKKGKGLIIGSQALAGNPYDGHTLSGSLIQAERVTSVKIKTVYVDKGYKGHDVTDKAVYISGQRRGVNKGIKRKLKRRQAIEPYIGHMKKIGKLALSRLKGAIGDEANAILAAAGYNLKLILNYLRILLPNFWKVFLYFCGAHFLHSSREYQNID